MTDATNNEPDAVMMSDDERRVLALFDGPGSLRLIEIMAALNPPPQSKRAFWRGGPILNQWRDRNADIWNVVIALENAGLLQCVRRRWLTVLLKDEYVLTAAACKLLGGVGRVGGDG